MSHHGADVLSGGTAVAKPIATVAAEHDRRHAELTPQFEITATDWVQASIERP